MSITLEQLLQKSSRITTYEEAKNIIGGNQTTGFSEVTKMPCRTYSLPATMCKTGTKLRSVKGSTCSDCYACPQESATKHIGGWYGTDRVEQPMTHRLLQVLFNPRWTDAMIFLLSRYKWPLFRWHDSGDIQNDEHFENLCVIADAVPKTKFWLPTQEWDIVERYWRKKGMILLKELHPNLIVRLSARMRDGPAPVAYAKMMGVTTSRVSTKESDVDCPAGKQGNNCGACRKCWDNNVDSVTYHFHNGHDSFINTDFMKNVKHYMIEMLDLGVTKKVLYKRTAKKFSINEIVVRVVARRMRLEMEKKYKVLNS